MWTKTAPRYEAKDEATGDPLAIKLPKSLNGLKQSPDNWHDTIETFLVGIGVKALQSDPFVYILNGTPKTNQVLSTDDDSTVIRNIYADDVLRAG